MRPRVPRIHIVTVLGVALVVFASACSSSTAPPTADTPTSAMAEVLDFSAPKLGGGTVEGTDYAGKDTAIWFWAPW